MPTLQERIAASKAKKNTATKGNVVYQKETFKPSKNFTIKNVPKTPYPYQIEGVEFLTVRDGNAILGDDMGVGKAQPWDAKILTPSGWKLMIELKRGSLVYGSDGLPHQVLGVYPQGIKNIYKVTFTDGSNTECCEDHLWTIVRNKIQYVRPLKNFKDALMNKYGDSIFAIPMVKPIVFPTAEQELHPYLIGCLLGDGEMSNGGIRFSCEDSSILENFINVLPADIIIKPAGRGDYKLSKKETENVWSTNSIRNEIKRLRINTKSEYKFIPDIYKFADIEQRTAVFQGLMDTDGYIAKGGSLQFTSVSEQLCDDMRFLIESFGGKATKRHKFPTYTHKEELKQGKKAYTLTISLPVSISPFLCVRKKELYKPRTKYFPTRRFKSVELVGKKYCQCIAIRSKDNLYVTDHCILTHNTAQAIMYLQHNQEVRPAVVICKSTLKLKWPVETFSFSERKTINTAYILNGRVHKSIQEVHLRGDGTVTFTEHKRMPKTGIFVINYEIFHNWVEELIELNAAVYIIDEAQYMKNPKSERWKALKVIKKKTGVRRFIPTTGTLLENRPMDMYNAISLVAPDMFPNQFMFGKRYCGGKKTPFGWDFSGASNLEELNTRLSSIMIRRMKSEVLTQLPPKQRIPIHLKIDMTEYNKIKNGMSEGPAKREKLFQEAALGKLDEVLDWIEDFLATGAKLVVFAFHKEIVNAIYQEFKKWAIKVDGSTSPKDKQNAEFTFQNDKKCRLLVGNLKSAGEGLTLTEAYATATVELLDHTPTLHLQAEDRVNRLGQESQSIFAYYFIAVGTVDEESIRELEVRSKIAGKVLDGKSKGDFKL